MIEILPLTACCDYQLEMLLDAAFGEDRKSRTAYMLRQGMTAIGDLSYGLIEAGILVGSIQCWPIQITGDDGLTSDLILVGPVAIAPGRQNQGLGQMLMNAAIKAAELQPPHSQMPPMIMIGDPEYYGRFGFSAGDTAGWRLPGPFEQHRLLLRYGGSRALPRTGMIGPRES